MIHNNDVGVLRSLIRDTIKIVTSVSQEGTQDKINKLILKNAR